MGDRQRTLTTQSDKFEFDFASDTDLGKSRPENQDRCGWFETSNSGSYVIVVADGMGGHVGGGVAAEIAIESVRTVFGAPFSDPKQTLIKSFEHATKQLSDRAEADSALKNMGCTLSVALYFERSVYSAHIGDSRIYRFCTGNCEQVSEDHSLVQEMVKQGALNPKKARTHPRSNILLRALTTNSTYNIDYYEPIQVRHDDVFLVCSDGLWNMVEDSEIQQVANNNTAEKAVRLLIDRANELGGKDNIAVGIMRIT